LVEHSINVYNHLLKLNSLYGLCTDEETLAIISLLHDVTKIGCYKEDFRNVKNDDGIWEKVPCFTFDEKFAFGGHGGKSVYLIQKYMWLTDEEAACINTHMGAFDRPTGDYSVSSAFEMFPLALLLHTADMLATCIDEKKATEVVTENKDNELEKKIEDILSYCKKAIDNGIDKELVYAVIAENNNEKKNPNSIKDIEVADKVMTALEEKITWSTKKTKKTQKAT